MGIRAVILLGAPGAGKGTLSQEVCEQTAFEHVSTGDMLRAAVKAESPVGQRAAAFMRKGELVPDAVILDVVRERLKQEAEDAALLFDGFPRTAMQANMLEDLLRESQARLAQVVLLEVPREVLVERLAGRRVCRACGAVFHIKNIPPREPGVCDACGGALYQRSDDTEATVLNRLEVYERQTAELIDYYKRRAMLKRLNAAGDRHEIARTLAAWLRE